MYKSFFKPLTKNKTLEIEFDTTNNSWFVFSFKLTKNHDHAGLYFTLSILKLELRVQIYDNRHWNWDENRWYYEGEEYNKSLEELKDLDKQFKNLDLQKYEIGDNNIHKFYLKQFQKLKSDLDLYKEILEEIKNSK